MPNVVDPGFQKQDEAHALALQDELAHAGRRNAMGQMSAAIAHEINQPLTAILSNVQAAQRILAADLADLGEVREILRDVVEDDKRAGEVIQRLRGLVRKQPFRVPMMERRMVSDTS